MKIVGIVLIFLISGCGATESPLKPPIPAFADAQHIYEPLGLDGIHCWKMQADKAQWQEVLATLHLETMESYPAYDTRSGNCDVDWWDVDFPRQAQGYWKLERGDRRLAAFIGGSIYITDEYR